MSVSIIVGLMNGVSTSETIENLLKSIAFGCRSTSSCGCLGKFGVDTLQLMFLWLNFYLLLQKILKWRKVARSSLHVEMLMLSINTASCLDTCSCGYCCIVAHCLVFVMPFKAGHLSLTNASKILPFLSSTSYAQQNCVPREYAAQLHGWMRQKLFSPGFCTAAILPRIALFCCGHVW